MQTLEQGDIVNNTMKVYRLERKGLGPFSQKIGDDTRYKTGHALGEKVMFKKGDNHSHFLFGVDNPDKLLDYFGEAYYGLIEEGFEIKEYEVPKRRIRNSQGRRELAFHVGSTEDGINLGIRNMLIR